MDITKNEVEGLTQVNETRDAEKKASVNAEMKRMMSLPANSGYAVHRIRVLHKMLQLLSSQARSRSENEELEILFAGLSL